MFYFFESTTPWSNYLPQRAKVLTFESMIARFSFASTGKCNSMIELSSSTEVLTQRLHAFLSPRRENVTQWSNYLPQRAKVFTRRSNLTPQRAKNIVNQQANITQWSNYLPQRAEILSQRSQRVNSTSEENCESTGKIYNSMVELFTSTGRDIESAISTCELNGRRIL